MGYLVPDKGLIKVYAPYSGVIENKFVKQGQRVKHGDILFQVSTARGASKGLSVNQRLITELKYQKELLKERIQTESLVNANEIEQIKLSINNTNNEIKQLKVQQSIQSKQLKLAKQNRQKFENLKKNNTIAETEYFDKQNDYLSIKALYEQTQSQIIEQQGIIKTLQKQLEQLPLTQKQNGQKLQTSLSLLKQRIIELEGDESYAIKASTSGIVTAIQANIGQVVSANSSLLTIIPEDTELVAELFLPSRAIGFVQKGQKVLIKFDAFAYQQFGLYEGKIDEISQSIIPASEAGIPLVNNEPVYKIKVILDKQFITAYGKKIKLQAGMQLNASIVLETRTLGQWLLAPIFSLKGNL